ncbi:MAG: glycoside hydrolase family 15 protein [Clostridia bacterium]|nr:glycoside hydrolase family 15 protein [Clostridia bacterium]
MNKTYFNNAIIGNSRMLGCLSDKGELVRLFWPHIDFPQHIDKMKTGIFIEGQHNSTKWLDGDDFMHTQQYVGDTNIVETNFIDNKRGLKVRQLDFCVIDKDIVIRRYEMENIGESEVKLGFAAYSSFISTNPDMRNTLFDFACDSLIHYKHGYYISISGDREVYQFQLGNNAFDSATFTELNGYDHIGMMPDGAVTWKLGSFMPGGKGEFNLFICASQTLKGVKKMIREAKAMDFGNEFLRTKEYWENFVKGAKRVNTGIAKIDELYRRSVLVFKLMSDDASGGLLAAPEIDEHFTRCGRYGYCWGRDAAFITGALDKCGLAETVDKFYDWAVEAQDDDGSWHQRHHMDGNLAPSWGFQVDETGTLIWGMLQHYKVTRDTSFLEKVWDSVKKAVDFLVNFIDGDTGLPKPSFDLWEERFGEHAYSSAAVYGGIKAGVEIARILGRDREMAEAWSRTADSIKSALEKNFWKEDYNRFIRSVRVKLNPWGAEPSQSTAVIEVNPKGFKREVTLEDWKVDISLLGVSVPFGLYDACDYRVEGTADLIEKVLSTPGDGGIMRYENDNYIGGNPWILTTLWLALYYIEKKEYNKAREYFDWAVKGCTGLGLLPEQISRETGKPAWVIPLTWSHAMFILVLFGLIEAGEI